jgi:hypothetical protein
VTLQIQVRRCRRVVVFTPEQQRHKNKMIVSEKYLGLHKNNKNLRNRITLQKIGPRIEPNR